MNAEPPVNFRAWSELVKASFSQDPSTKNVVLEDSQSDFNATQPDFPAQNVKQPDSESGCFKKHYGGLSMKENLLQPKSDVQSDFDLEALRMGQDFSAISGVRKTIMSVPVRKPNKQWFFRVRLGEEWRFTAHLLIFKEENETYLVHPSIAPDLMAEITPTALFTCISRQEVLFLWPVRLPGPDGRIDNWSQTAVKAAEIAQDHWVRVVPNMQLGAYEVYKAQENLEDPRWPDVSFENHGNSISRQNYIRF